MRISFYQFYYIVLFDGDDSGVTKQNELLYDLSMKKSNGNYQFL